MGSNPDANFQTGFFLLPKAFFFIRDLFFSCRDTFGPPYFLKKLFKIKEHFWHKHIFTYEKKTLSVHDPFKSDSKLILISSVKLISNGITQENIVLLCFTIHTLYHFSILSLL